METVKRFRQGTGAKDGSFELRFLAGRQLETQTEERGETKVYTLTGLRIDPADPAYLMGRRSDGIEIRIEVKTLKMRKSDRDALIAELSARAEALSEPQSTPRGK